MREIPFGRPMIGEEEKKAVMEALNSPVLVHGPQAQEFEAAFADFVNAPYAVSLSSCTAGLHLSYFQKGIGPGDEVIVPAQTHVATAHAVEFTGAKPVFVDAERETGNIDIELIEPAITHKTKAISVVHFLGMPVNMEKIMAIAQKHHLFVVEDCALALGTRFKGIHAGLHGDTGCFSFYPIKHMTTAEGGMLITRHADVAAQIGKRKAFGLDRHVGERKVPGVYDVTTLGYNYRLNEIQSSLGVQQLKRMESFLQIREKNYRNLADGLKEMDEVTLFNSSHGEYQSSYYCCSVFLNESLACERDHIIHRLNAKGVGTSVYYPEPVAHFTYYREKYGYQESSFPVAAWISHHGIALPVGPHLNGEDMDYIVQSLKEIIREVKTHEFVSG